MSGAVLSLLGGGAAVGGGGGVGAPALDWANIYGLYSASNAPVTIAGIAGPINLAASITGGGYLSYTLGSTTASYAGPFGVVSGDKLSWTVSNGGYGAISGTVSVTNQSDGGAAVGSFTYVVRAPSTGDR